MTNPLHVIAYDVSDDGRRDRLHRLLRQYGRRSQYSVFEARLGVRDLADLLRRAAPFVDPATDQLAVWRVSERANQAVVVLGYARPPLDEPRYFVL